MSHLKERTEKNCLNCNAQVIGKYCHICGQENIQPKESFWHLVNHFFQDITHFDGKFFSSMGLLFTRPGFLSAEYVRGRRSSYLNPIRMYVFTSAVFFLIFFSFVKPKDEDAIKIDEPQTATATVAELKDKKQAYATLMVSVKDSTKKRKLLQKIELIDQDLKMIAADSTQFKDLHSNKEGFDNIIHFWNESYETRQEYDAYQQKLPADKRDGWVKKRLVKRAMMINAKYRNNRKEFQHALLEKFFHSFPQMFFISLPIFALFLKLMYWRRKEFYYVSHGIFAIHLYIFSFIAFLVIFAVGSLQEKLNWGILDFLMVILTIGSYFYFYKAMRNFYQQRRAKTVWKFIFLNIFLLILMIVLFLTFLIVSLTQI